MRLTGTLGATAERASPMAQGRVEARFPFYGELLAANNSP
jgi:hypothetical protein